MDLSEKLIEAEELSALGDCRKAIEILLSVIKECVAAEMFEEAEILRQRILSIDDMAISDIIEAADIIEGARSSLIPDAILKTWSEFSSHFTETEFNALFYSIHLHSLDANKIIYEQGRRNDFLYFLNEGTVKSVYSKEGTEILVQTLGPGSMFGHESLFSLSLNPTTIKTLTSVSIGLLSDFAIRRIMVKHPGIFSKLKSYGQALVSSQDIFMKRGLTRRSHERFRIERNRLTFTILGASGKALTREHTGEFSDISVGGLSFFTRITNGDHLKKLLGKNIALKFELPGDQECASFEKTGLVTGVIAQMFNEYSLHVKFDHRLEQLPEKI